MLVGLRSLARGERTSKFRENCFSSFEAVCASVRYLCARESATPHPQVVQKDWKYVRILSLEVIFNL